MSTPWHVVQQILADRGLANPDGIGRKVRAGACRGCGRTVLRGLDADRCGLPASVDPAPVSDAVELAALLAGRWTYELHRVAGGHEIDLRDEHRVRGHPASQIPVLVEHRCGAQLPGLPPDPPALRTTPTEVPAY